MQNLNNLLHEFLQENKYTEYASYFREILNLKHDNKEAEKLAKQYHVDYPESITQLIYEHEGILPTVEVEVQTLVNNYLLRIINLNNQDKEQVLKGFTFLELSPNKQLSQILIDTLYLNKNTPLGVWLFAQEYTASPFLYQKLDNNTLLRLRCFKINCQRYIGQDLHVNLFLVEVFTLNVYQKYFQA
ncbi:hypothetical protein CJP74_04385 [Psittacicella melopsittaci]|uniref:Chorismate lyase n=1 Tax=Psittacicella melopsittaci TaxID=2028576 RepID=A0A3A1Y8R8_9GAMM|nr:hypothetical protein [Psittacicella melopsittaci]RIY32524.1 hypothetical protein CJP74_04385 [Psittacicella melopsittaci]